MNLTVLFLALAAAAQVSSNVTAVLPTDPLRTAKNCAAVSTPVLDSNRIASASLACGTNARRRPPVLRGGPQPAGSAAAISHKVQKLSSLATPDSVGQLYGDQGLASNSEKGANFEKLLAQLQEPSSQPKAPARSFPAEAIASQELRDLSHLAPPEPYSCGSVRGSLRAVPGAYSALEGVAGCLPEWAGGAAVRHYLDVLGLRGYRSSVGASNEGLNRHLARLSATDPIYFDQVRAFYDWVRQRDFVRSPTGANRPNLSQAAGEGRDATIEPGWAWRLAMRVSGGNAHRALEIISFCGHDDVSQSPLTFVENAGGTGLNNLAFLQASIAALRSYVGGVRDPKLVEWVAKATAGVPAEQVLAAWEQNLRARPGDAVGPRSFNICPSPDSALYLPGSLDADADISEELKRRVAAAQAPTRGAEVLPAKYYHVYAGAFASCELIRKGMPGVAAELLEERAAWAYRTIRMKNQMAAALSRRDEFLVEYRQRGLVARLFSSEEEFLHGKGLSPLELARLDGFYLLDKLGGSLAGLPLRPSPVSLELATKPFTWSKERFDAAMGKLKTYLLDWEWTIAQHEAGARFARRVCAAEQTRP